MTDTTESEAEESNANKRTPEAISHGRRGLLKIAGISLIGSGMSGIGSAQIQDSSVGLTEVELRYEDVPNFQYCSFDYIQPYQIDTDNREIRINPFISEKAVDAMINEEHVISENSRKLRHTSSKLFTEASDLLRVDGGRALVLEEEISPPQVRVSEISSNELEVTSNDRSAILSFGSSTEISFPSITVRGRIVGSGEFRKVSPPKYPEEQIIRSPGDIVQSEVVPKITIANYGDLSLRSDNGGGS